MQKVLLYVLTLLTTSTLFSCSDEGCTDAMAANYDPTATIDDGSCVNNFPDDYTLAKYYQYYHNVYGGSGNNDDELTSGIVTDALGNLYFSLNTNDAAANNNILVGKINTNGTLAWAKEWDGNYDDESPDSGGNGETGGTANSLTVDSDGNLYVVGRTADILQNNIVSALVLKINPLDGSLLWQKVWKHNWPTGTPVASMDAQGYGIDASGDYVYITGSNGLNEVPVVALQKTDGSSFFELTVDIVSGTTDKGYVVKPDASGNLYIGGISGSMAHLTKIGAANTATPSVTWTKRIDLGFAGRINSMDIDGNDLYISCDRRGALTYFSVIKVSTDGVLQWGKTFPGNSDRNNTHVVTVAGNSVYVGGRIFQTGLDAQFGDGLLIKLDKAAGNLEWSGTYYTGGNSSELAEHRIKGIAISGTEVFVAGQVYSGNNNTDHFFGSWITKPVTLDNYTPSITDLTPSSSSVPANGEVRNATGTYTDANSNYVIQSATTKTTSNPPDGDFFIMRMNLL